MTGSKAAVDVDEAPTRPSELDSDWQVLQGRTRPMFESPQGKVFVPAKAASAPPSDWELEP